MINPNIASKVFKIFSQMAHRISPFLLREENVEDMSQTEWKIIQQIILEFQNAKLQRSCSCLKDYMNYLSGILSKLNYVTRN